MAGTTQAERAALTGRVSKPVRLETWLYEQVGAEYRYIRLLDFGNFWDLGAILDYMNRYIATAEEDGFNVSLWVDGAPQSHLTGNAKADPWR